MVKVFLVMQFRIVSETQTTIFALLIVVCIRLSKHWLKENI